MGRARARGWWRSAWTIGGVLLAMAAAPAAGVEPSFTVSYVTESAVYLDSGSAGGLVAGDRLELRRNGDPVAELEVAYVARHSASCRVVTQRRTVQPGDRATVVSRASSAAAAPATATAPVEPRSAPAPTSGTAPPPTPPPPPLAGIPRTSTARISAPPPWAKARGSGSILWYRTRDEGELGTTTDEQTARLRLRVSDIAHRPLELRVRLRSRQEQRAVSDRGADRLYELSLSYEPPEGRFALHVGRLGAGPFVTLGYLDGALAQVRVLGPASVGAFYGRRPEIEQLGFGSSGRKYGGYVRAATAPQRPGLFGEVVLAGVNEYDALGRIDRRYAALESRLGRGTRWNVYQLAELDLARGWSDGAAKQPSQLSTLSISGSVRLSDPVRAVLSYDRRRNYRVADTRLLPEEQFDRLLRQGFQGSLYLGRGSGWFATVSAGARSREGGGDTTNSGGFSLAHNNVAGKRLMLGGDATAYTGGTVEGWLVSLRARKYLRGGHDLGLTIGASQVTPVELATPRHNEWARLSGSAQLPWDLFAVAEVEVDRGDDFDGQRFTLELGYRF